MLWAMLLLLGAGIVVAIAMGDSGTLGGMDGAMVVSLVGGLCLVIVLAGPVLSSYRGGVPKAVRDLGIWVGLILLLILGYSFRDDAKIVYQRIAGELLPPGQTLTVTSENGGQAVRIRKRSDGHFTARGQVNGASINLLVDTGASTIVLKASDARAAGIDVETLNFSVPVQTANGSAFAAATRLSSIAVGPIVLYNVRALVAKPGALRESLLGMNFLTQLKSYEFSGDYLTFRS